MKFKSLKKNGIIAVAVVFLPALLLSVLLLPVTGFAQERGRELAVPEEVGNRVVAHRGGSLEAGLWLCPDNSIAALRYAIGLGCYASECDIYLTGDDHVIVAHADDESCINGLRPWEHTLAEIRNAGRLVNGEQIPTLEDYLQVVLDAGTTRLWLDVKNVTVNWISDPEWREVSARVCERACEIITEMGANNFCEFIVTSNPMTTPSNGKTIMQRCFEAGQAAGCPVGWMSFTSPEKYTDRGYPWANLGANHLFFFGRPGEGPWTVEDYLDAGLKFSVYYVNSNRDMDYYLSFVDRMYAFCSDFPKRLLSKWPSRVTTLKKTGPCRPCPRG